MLVFPAKPSINFILFQDKSHAVHINICICFSLQISIQRYLITKALSLSVSEALSMAPIVRHKYCRTVKGEMNPDKGYKKGLVNYHKFLFSEWMSV